MSRSNHSSGPPIGGSDVDPRPTLDRSAGCVLKGPLGSVHLTPIESRLLQALAVSEAPIPRERIYREVFLRPWSPLDRSVDVHVANLRRKFKAVGCDPTLIVARRSQGYFLRGMIDIA